MIYFLFWFKGGFIITYNLYCKGTEFTSRNFPILQRCSLFTINDTCSHKCAHKPLACDHRWASAAASKSVLFEIWGCTPETCCCFPHRTHSCPLCCLLNHPCRLTKEKRKTVREIGITGRQSVCGRQFLSTVMLKVWALRERISVSDVLSPGSPVIETSV